MLQNSGTLERFVLAGLALALLCVVGGIAAHFSVGASDDSSFSLLLQSFLEIGLIVAGQTVFAGFYFGFLHLLHERRLFPRKRRSD
jgi:hypothetical protein